MEWTKSSKSAGNGCCVEVAFYPPDVVAVRNSRLPLGPVLSFTLDEWEAFAAGVRAGEFVPSPPED